MSISYRQSLWIYLQVSMKDKVVSILERDTFVKY